MTNWEDVLCKQSLSLKHTLRESECDSECEWVEKEKEDES